ncbi:hypothetical protein KTT_04760 [Tengunoibacter tsumagoiensis]|uniref:Uncharacterized protein n=1 Tax=Tengunoibacter tsumagoiensis TaxID=2014871 RepID=A0A401ZUV2_9CHLR|nr:hypothetical protein KTT_04760 [Tengunoibacter tsumagoiensis]
MHINLTIKIACNRVEHCELSIPMEKRAWLIRIIRVYNFFLPSENLYLAPLHKSR